MFMIAAKLCALFTVALGIGGMFFPAKVIRMISLDLRPDRVEAITEVRATLGGLFLFVGLFVFLTNSIDAYATLGSAWMGAAVVRALFIIPDRSITRINIGSTVLELFIGIWLILPKLMQHLS